MYTHHACAFIRNSTLDAQTLYTCGPVHRVRTRCSAHIYTCVSGPGPGPGPWLLSVVVHVGVCVLVWGWHANGLVPDGRGDPCPYGHDIQYSMAVKPKTKASHRAEDDKELACTCTVRTCWPAGPKPRPSTISIPPVAPAACLPRCQVQLPAPAASSPPSSPSLFSFHHSPADSLGPRAACLSSVYYRSD